MTISQARNVQSVDPSRVIFAQLVTGAHTPICEQLLTCRPSLQAKRLAEIARRTSGERGTQAVWGEWGGVPPLAARLIERAAASPSANPVGGTGRQGVSLASLPLEAEAGRACSAARGGNDGHDRHRHGATGPPRCGDRRRAVTAAAAPTPTSRSASSGTRWPATRSRSAAGSPRRTPLGHGQGRRQEGQDRPQPTRTGSFTRPLERPGLGHLQGEGDRAGHRARQARRARAPRQINVYRPAAASYYGPGLYGNGTACGADADALDRGRRPQDAAVRHEGHAPLPRARPSRSRSSTAGPTPATASTT